MLLITFEYSILYHTIPYSTILYSIFTPYSTILYNIYIYTMLCHYILYFGFGPVVSEYS